MVGDKDTNRDRPHTTSSADKNTEGSRSNDLPAVLETIFTDADRNDHTQSWRTFAASYVGFCPRQTYLVHLGLRDNTGWQGRFRARRLIQDYLKQKLGETHGHLDVEPNFTVDIGQVQLAGHPACFDPSEQIVYHIKPRNGWYKFNPPVDRHLNQFHVYLHGLDADAGQLVYVSMADLADIRVWPADYQDRQYVAFDSDRFDRLIEKAEVIREEIITNGIATTLSEIPFEKCGCYLCQTEAIELPEQTTDERTCQSRAVTQSGEFQSKSESDTTTTRAATRSPASAQPDIPPVDVSTDADATTVLATNTEHIPQGLRDHRLWVVWDCQQKLALAPWQTGTMYPCEWARDKDVDPRRPFEKAQIVAELPINQVHAAWPFPDSDDLPDNVKPAVLLPHDPPNPPITFVDFDDVRDPATGAVPQEVADLCELLGGYTEVSSSGTGIHCWVRAALPEGNSIINAPLETRGHVELYDHSRFTGGTWRHVAGTPHDEVPYAQEALNRLVATYTSTE